MRSVWSVNPKELTTQMVFNCDNEIIMREPRCKKQLKFLLVNMTTLVDFIQSVTEHKVKGLILQSKH